jgi:hypothetical protein
MTVINDLKQKVSKLDILINCVQYTHNPAMANTLYNNEVKLVLKELQENMSTLVCDLVLEIAKEDDADECILWNAKCIGEDRAKKAKGEQHE